MEITKLIDIKNEEDIAKEQFALDVLNGFSETPKHLSAKYFYDDRGSELFQKITKHEDYYPCRTELEILNNIKFHLPSLISDKEIDVIELGPGDGHKSKIILEGLIERGHIVNYYPVDISERALNFLKKNISEHRSLRIHGVVAEYFDGLNFARNNSSNRQMVMFLGSNIGNFRPKEGQNFLRQLWRGLNARDYVLIGFDLKKDINILSRAYDDSDGLTKEFNLNLLLRINRELAGEFDVEKFHHHAIYNPVIGAMESYLISMEEQSVYIGTLQKTFSFKAFEPILLEHSFKYLKSDIDELCEISGHKVVEHYYDKEGRFIDSLWEVVK